MDQTSINAIRRQLGIFEGLAASLTEKKESLILSCIDIIDEILNREEGGKTNG